MTRYDRYKEKLLKLEEKSSLFLRSGRYVQAQELHRDIEKIKNLIEEAHAYEESRNPRPLYELTSKEELGQMGIIPLMIECHLITDMLV